MQLLCLASAVSSPGIGDMRAAKQVGRYLRKAPVAWHNFPFHDPQPQELLCYTDADWTSEKTSRRSMSGGVVTLGGGVLNCWAKKQNSVALSSWESELFAAVGHEIIGNPERVDGSWVQLQCHSCDRQSECH